MKAIVLATLIGATSFSSVFAKPACENSKNTEYGSFSICTDRAIDGSTILITGRKYKKIGDGKDQYEMFSRFNQNALDRFCIMTFPETEGVSSELIFSKLDRPERTLVCLYRLGSKK